MKNVLLSLATVLAALGAAAQEPGTMQQADTVKQANTVQQANAVKKADRADPAKARKTVEFGRVRENPNQFSVSVAGYELLLEGEGRRETRRARERRCGRPYGGRIGFLEVGFNGFREGANAYSMYPASEEGFMDLNMGRSDNFTFNIFTFSTSFTRKNIVGLTMGIGLSTSDFTFETATGYKKVDKMIVPYNTGRYLKKAKLHTLSLHVPLVLEINPTRNFFFSVGGYADLMIGSHMKWKKPKEKLYNPYTNFLQAGLTARIGFRHVYIYGNYGLVEMFKEGCGPVLTPYTVGFGFLFGF